MARKLRYDAPWEQGFKKVSEPLEDFIHKETGSGVLLMIATLVALIMANSALAEAYHHFFETKLAFTVGGYTLEHTLHHWINDGLMALFFFVVGLEIKREILTGELSSPSKAALPMIAAIGGMVVPALFFYALNIGGPAAAGWGIPMATDIAFAIGVLVLLGDRIPKALIAFLMALAIVDDLGAVVVIAIFYTESINTGPLIWAGVFLGILILFNIVGLRSRSFHFAIGACLWLSMMESGIHATIAGVLGALTVPGRPKFSTKSFSTYMRDLISQFDRHDMGGTTMNTNDGQRHVVQQISHAVETVESPIRSWEAKMHIPVAFLVIPLFALANAAIPIEWSALGSVFSDPLALGIMLGLIAGKVIGIAGSTMLAVKLGIGQLPEGTSGRDIVGISFLGGIGFTMSIFITELAFPGQTELLIMAKTGILFASFFAAFAGIVWLALVRPKNTAQ